MATSFFGGAFFGGEFFNTPAPTPPSSSAPTPAGMPSRNARRKRKVIVGERLYEVESLRDVEFLLKRIVREQDPEPIAKAAKGRVRVVDRITARVDAPPPVVVPATPEADWSQLWAQLAIQDRAYAEILERVLMRQEEDDIEAILLTMH